MRLLRVSPGDQCTAEDCWSLSSLAKGTLPAQKDLCYKAGHGDGEPVTLAMGTGRASPPSPLSQVSCAGAVSQGHVSGWCGKWPGYCLQSWPAPSMDHPHCCWILSQLRGLEEFVQGRLGWQECSLSGLQYLQPLISQILPSQTLVTKWVWSELLFLVNRLSSKGLACVWDGLRQPVPAWCGTAHGQVCWHVTGFLCLPHPSSAPVTLSVPRSACPAKSTKASLDICWGHWWLLALPQAHRAPTALGSVALEPPARLCLQSAQSRHPAFKGHPLADADIFPLPQITQLSHLSPLQGARKTQLFFHLTFPQKWGRLSCPGCRSRCQNFWLAAGAGLSVRHTWWLMALMTFTSRSRDRRDNSEVALMGDHKYNGRLAITQLSV